MRYWGEVAVRAAKEAAKELHIDSPSRVVVGLTVQIVATALIWLLVGSIPHATMMARVAITLASFAAYPIVLAMKMLAAHYGVESAEISENPLQIGAPNPV